MSVLLQTTTATSGTVTSIDTQQDLIVIHDAGLTVNLTVTMPSSPVDGQLFTLASTGGITTLALNAVATVANALGAMTSGASGTWVYSGARSKWVKIR